MFIPLTTNFFQFKDQIPNNPTIPDKVFIDCEGETGISLPHPDVCEFYFFCAGERSYLQVCGSGLSFDVKTGRCQTANTATCILDVEAPSTDPPPPIEGGSIQALFNRILNRL